MKLEEAHWFNAQMQCNLSEAREIQKQITLLNEKVDYLCTPYVEEVARQISLSDPLEAYDVSLMVEAVPDSFYRSELRTALIEKFGRGPYPNAELCGVRSTSERAPGYASAPKTEE